MSLLRRGTFLALCLAFAWAFSPASAAPGPLCYVDIDAVGIADGSSWVDAYTDLQDALADANCTEIWVAEGTYTPDGASPGNRGLSFNLKSGIEIYGGFDGTEAAHSERDWQAHTTILSGEIGGAGVSDNSLHVVVGSGTDATAVLDGFTVRDGYADAEGGGMYISAGSPTLSNLLFAANTANTVTGSGGGMYIVGGSPTMTRVAFSGNAASNGGGLFAVNSSFQLTEGIFRGNTASHYGGGVFTAGGTPQLSQVLFEDNSADIGGALAVGNSVPLTNVTFYNNTALDGGAVYISAGSPIFNHATFNDNTPNAMYYLGGGLPTVRNSIFWNNSISVDGSAPGAVFSDNLIEGGCPSLVTCSGTLLTADPLLGPLQDNGGFSHTQAIPPTSPAFNTANGSTCAANDQRGAARPQGAGCDMGAYEVIITASGPRCYVDADMTWAGNGSFWAEAYADLQDALTNTNCTEIWVAEGAYQPDGASPGDRTLSFNLKSGVEIYGGFAGTETLLSQRDWGINTTILSGEIGGPGSSDNSYHVVVGGGTDATAVLDGFTIRDANADASFPDNAGAGVLNISGSPSLTNLVIRDNNTLGPNGGGAGMLNRTGSNPKLVNVAFIGNTAANDNGGGMYNQGSNPSLLNVTFIANTAMNGGAMSNLNSDPLVENTTFAGNIASGTGGGMENQGSDPVLNNVTFHNNSASIGAGMANAGGDLTLNNVTFSNNSASTDGGVMRNSTNSDVQIHNSILWGNTPNQISNISAGVSLNISDSLVQGGCLAGLGTITCTNLLDSNPLLGPLQDNGGFTHTMALDAASPAVDAANSSTCTAEDQRGVARPQHAGCDMGAYEYDGALPPPVPSAPEDAGGPEGASKDIASTGLTTLHFGRIWVSVPAGAIPPGQTDCRLTVRPVGDSGEYGFSLDDTVWDVKIICDSGELNLFFDALTICIRPADGISGDKNVYHRHGGGGFGAISGGSGPSGYVCGQTRTLSLFTLGQLVLPATGFAPGMATQLPAQPAELAYTNSGLTLSIPKLGVEMDILGVPQGPNGWDVTWLTSNQAGYLYGTAFPTWKGNSVLTAHVWNADNTPGPFHALRSLQHGDRFTIQAYGYTYTYEVRSNRLVSESNLNVLNSNSQYSQITLITCETFSESSGGYLYRRAVQAVLVAVSN